MLGDEAEGVSKAKVSGSALFTPLCAFLQLLLPCEPSQVLFNLQASA